MWKRFAQLNVLRNCARTFRAKSPLRACAPPTAPLGVLATGSLDLKLFTAMIDNMPEGTWEFVCHPGYNDAELDRCAPGCGNRASRSCRC